MRNCFEMISVCMVSCLLLVVFCAAMSSEEAKNACCAENLKGLHAAILEYSADHGQLPPVIVKGTRWKFWMHSMAPYFEDDILACPADLRNAAFFTGNASPLAPKARRGANSYGMNYFLTTSFAAKKGKTPLLSNLTRPERTFVFGDCKGPYMYPDRYWKEERSAWHENETVNMIHADGHVKNYAQSDMGKPNAAGKFIFNLSYWLWI